MSEAMTTKEWVKACPKMKEGDRVMSVATSLNGVRNESVGEFLRMDPEFKGFYIVRWNSKRTTSVPWDSVEKVQ